MTQWLHVMKLKSKQKLSQRTILLTFSLITIALLKCQSKQKHLLPYHVKNNKLKTILII